MWQLAPMNVNRDRRDDDVHEAVQTVDGPSRCSPWRLSSQCWTRRS
jgi:hypothetical protein